MHSGAVQTTGYPASIEQASSAQIHRIHDRYLVEVVEALGLCPFARRSRELGRVHRILFLADTGGPTPVQTAAAVASCVHQHDDAEIVLPTFVGSEESIAEPERFDGFVAAVREAFAEQSPQRWFMVGFHPGLGGPEARDRDTDPHGRPLTKDSLVPLIRRSPDPVIQCVNATVLDRVRSQAQEAAHRRLIEQVGNKDPILRALVERSVQADSELSADIARANFENVGTGPGREALERVLADIAADRNRTYARLGLPVG